MANEAPAVQSLRTIQPQGFTSMRTVQSTFNHVGNRNIGRPSGTQPMRKPFTCETILGLDPEEFTASEKRELLERFFPAMPIPEWKLKLKTDWSNSRRWGAYLGTDTIGDEGSPYRYTPRHLELNARFRKGTRKGNRVSDFTNWIYSLYRKQPANPEALATGKRVERQVAAQLGDIPQSSDWELIYADPLSQAPVPRRISALEICGQPIWGAPDLVFRNRTTGAITIVERKASNREIPSDGWPNLRAQLWAYGHIDDWANAPIINLVGEVWGFTSTRVFLSKVIRWDLDDPTFYGHNEKLFMIYAEQMKSGTLSLAA